MKRHITLTVGVVLLLSGAMLFAAGQGKKKMKMKMKTVTVTGTLIDTKCYGMNHDNIGNDHITPKGKVPNCASACASMGIPVGVLIGGKKGGDVVFLITPAGQLAKYMAKTARVTGQKAIGGLIPMKIEVKENGKWKKVNIATMM